MRTRQIAKVVFVLSALFFLFSGGPEICQFLPGTQEAQAAAPVNSWWDLNYGIRKKIAIFAGSATVPSGYSVSITVDHASLVTAKQSLTNGDDVRIAYYNGSTWTELDRFRDLDTSWNNASTKIWFKTQAAINANNYNDNYYVYYSYPSATNPPANANNVFFFYDGFESGNFNAWDGTVTSDAGDSITISSSPVHTGTYSANCTVGNPTPGQAVAENYFDAQQGFSTTVWVYIPNSYSDLDYSSVVQYYLDWSNQIASMSIYGEDPDLGDNMKPYIYNIPGGQFYFSDTALTKDTWHRLEMRIKVSDTAGRAELWVDGVQKVNESGKNTGTNNINHNLVGIFWRPSLAGTIYIDNSFDRLWVDPEPTIIVGTQVTKMWGENSTSHYTGVSEDSYLDQGQPNYNMGAETLLRVGDETGSRADRSIMKFNFSNINITDSTQILSASLKVRTHSNPVSGDVTVDAFRVKINWNEGSGNYQLAVDAEDSVTWTYQLYDETSWTGAGCDNSADRSTTSDGSQTFSAVGTWYTWDVTGSAKYMYTNNQYYGWLLKSQSEATAKYWRVQSSENPTAANRPYLEITYIDKTVAEARYEHRKKLTIQSSQVGGSCSSNLSDFPVLVTLSGDWLKTKTNDPTNGRLYNSNGYDIAFRGENDETVLNYEIESYSATAGTLVAWVKIPTVYYNKNTDFYIYYGNAGITTAPAATVAQGVWDSSGYRGVWHLGESSGNALDSTSYGTNGSVSGTYTRPSTGQIGNAYDFGTNGQVAPGDPVDGHLDFGTGSFTVSFWLNLDDTTGTYQLPIHKGSTTQASPGYDFETNTSGSNIQMGITDDSNTAGGHKYSPSASLTFDEWTYIVGVVDRGNNMLRIYKNGVQQGTGTDITGVGNVSSTDPLLFPTADYDLNGLIDEVRVSNGARDACSIETEYSNQKTSSSFISEGTETRPTPTVVTLKSFKALQYGDGVLLKWKTSHEVNNLGFNVYREANGELLRLTPELVAGSALLAGSGTQLTAGHHYTWIDTPLLSTQHSALSTIRYWLEDVDLTGQRTFHGPVETLLPAPSSPLHASEVRRAELLSEFGARLQEKYADFWKIQDFREKLAQNPNKSASILKGRRPAPQAKRLALSTQHSALRTSGPRANVSLSSVDDRNETPAGRKLSAPLSDKPLKQSSEAQWSLAARPAMKLLVKEEGWYRVSQAELAAAGMNTNFNPRYMHLYADGNELPLRVIAEKESQFGPRDAIEFYGIGLDTPSTDTQVYWLVVGPKPGKRINSHISSSQFRPWSGLVDNPHSARGRVSSTIRNSFESSQFRNPQSAIRNSFESFPYTAEAKERSFYFPALLNGEESNFFGPILYTYRVDQLLYVWDADTSSPEDALLEIALQGATSVPHRVKVFFNDAEVGEVSFMGQSQGRLQAEIPLSALHAGENLVSFMAQGGEMDVSLLDYIHLTYWRNYRAHENALKLTAQGGRQVSVGGFSHAQIRVMDVTNPLEAVEVEGKVTKAQGSGYEVSFRAPGSGPRTLLALGVEKVKSPSQLLLNQPSRWHQGMNRYDLVIISHRDFLESLKPLKNLRENQGYSMALIDVEDVYDEFSFGSKTPQAIKDFLQRAKSSWQKPPRFVLLAGDASSDPRNYLGYGNFDFVPTKLVDTAYLETASDDWFVDFDGDGLPKMALGRLPVQTPQEASAMVAKIIAHEKSARTNEALLVADKTEKTDDFDFGEAAQKVGALFPSSVGLRKVFRGEYGSDAQAKEALLHYLAQGPLLVNYLGHGGMMEWRGHVLTADDAEGLLNGQRLPFFINMTCLNGFFQAPFADSLAEALLKAEQGGAVAVWTSSGMTEPGGQLKMNQELVRQLFNGEGLTIGEATMRAKKAVGDKDIRRTWILFGDPTTRLKP